MKKFWKHIAKWLIRYGIAGSKLASYHGMHESKVPDSLQTQGK